MVKKQKVNQDDVEELKVARRLFSILYDRPSELSLRPDCGWEFVLHKHEYWNKRLEFTDEVDEADLVQDALYRYIKYMEDRMANPDKYRLKKYKDLKDIDKEFNDEKKEAKLGTKN